MGSKTWIQHISGTGPKYEGVYDNCWGAPIWRVRRNVTSYDLYLDAADYKPCDPPEQWVQVTEGVEVGQYDKDDFSPGPNFELNGWWWVTVGDVNIKYQPQYKLVVDNGVIKVMKKVS